LAAVCAGLGYWQVTLPIGVACLLTLVEFPQNYWSLVSLDTSTVALVAARNAMLVAALVMGLWELVRLGWPGGARRAGGLPRHPHPRG
jgi:hypothetical protein